jgi:hypothetical protein
MREARAISRDNLEMAAVFRFGGSRRCAVIIRVAPFS